MKNRLIVVEPTDREIKADVPCSVEIKYGAPPCTNSALLKCRMPVIGTEVKYGDFFQTWFNTQIDGRDHHNVLLIEGDKVFHFYRCFLNSFYVHKNKFRFEISGDFMTEIENNGILTEWGPNLTWELYMEAVAPLAKDSLYVMNMEHRTSTNCLPAGTRYDNL